MPTADAPDLVLAHARDLVGPLEFVADRSWPHGVSTVIEVRAADGRALIVKSPTDVAKFDAELYAYRRWAPALAGHTPDLLAADRTRRLLVLSKLPGEIGDLSVSTFREAGRLLRLFQDAEPPTPIVGFAEAFRDRFETWIARARPGLLDDAEIDYVAAQVHRLAAFPDPDGVPCHRDWQPRNWLTAPDGSVSVIDFGHARTGHWFHDFERMWWAEWRTDPDLGVAFFEGYGRSLDDDAREQLRATSIVGLLTTVVWADEVDDAPFGAHGRANLHAAMAGTGDPF